MSFKDVSSYSETNRNTQAETLNCLRIGKENLWKDHNAKHPVMLLLEPKKKLLILKGWWIKKPYPYLKILGNRNEPTMAVLAQHTKIFTSLKVTVLKHSVKQCRTILNSISGINNETAYKLSNTICILSCIHPRYCKKTIKTTSVILIIF